MTIIINKINYGEVIRKHRISAGLSQSELCRKAGISNGLISAIERNYYKSPDLTTLLKISKALGLTLDELINCNKEAEASYQQVFSNSDKLTKQQVALVQQIINEIIRKKTNNPGENE
jgi:transcriptional regulator with XRE-family HTH domain